jgi:hypothetical protein
MQDIMKIVVIILFVFIQATPWILYWTKPEKIQRIEVPVSTSTRDLSVDDGPWEEIQTFIPGDMPMFLWKHQKFEAVDVQKAFSSNDKTPDRLVMRLRAVEPLRVDSDPISFEKDKQQIESGQGHDYPKHKRANFGSRGFCGQNKLQYPLMTRIDKQ